jgi:hypothetical protein
LISLWRRSSGSSNAACAGAPSGSAGGEHVLGGVLQEFGDLWELRTEHLRDLVQLAHRRGVIGLGEDRADDRGHGVLGLLGATDSTLRMKWTRQRCQVASCSTFAIAARSLVGVGDHEADPFEPSLDELAKERGPELVIFEAPV